MLDEQGHLKLIDFGSAKDLDAASAPVQQPPERRKSLQQKQRSSSMVGTAEYLAPEACPEPFKPATSYSRLSIHPAMANAVNVSCWPPAVASQVVLYMQMGMSLKSVTAHADPAGLAQRGDRVCCRSMGTWVPIVPHAPWKHPLCGRVRVSHL